MCTPIGPQSLCTPPQSYANQGTIDLANALLPTILQGKNKAQIVAILTDPANQGLVDLLRQFCNQTYRFQINRNRGLNTLCCCVIQWANVGNLRWVQARDMWNMNYLFFTYPGASDLSNFVFAVLYVVKWNLNNYLDQTLGSQGLTFCSRIIN